MRSALQPAGQPVSLSSASSCVTNSFHLFNLSIRHVDGQSTQRYVGTMGAGVALCFPLRMCVFVVVSPLIGGVMCRLGVGWRINFTQPDHTRGCRSCWGKLDHCRPPRILQRAWLPWRRVWVCGYLRPFDGACAFVLSGQGESPATMCVWVGSDVWPWDMFVPDSPAPSTTHSAATWLPWRRVWVWGYLRASVGAEGPVLGRMSDG